MGNLHHGENLHHGGTSIMGEPPVWEKPSFWGDLQPPPWRTSIMGKPSKWGKPHHGRKLHRGGGGTSIMGDTFILGEPPSRGNPLSWGKPPLWGKTSILGEPPSWGNLHCGRTSSAFVYVCLHVYTCMRVSMLVHACACACAQMRSGVCMQRGAHMHVRVHAPVCTRMCAQLHPLLPPPPGPCSPGVPCPCGRGTLCHRCPAHTWGPPSPPLARQQPGICYKWSGSVVRQQLGCVRAGGPQGCCRPGRGGLRMGQLITLLGGWRGVTPTNTRMCTRV